MADDHQNGEREGSVIERYVWVAGERMKRAYANEFVASVQVVQMAGIVVNSLDVRMTPMKLQKTMALLLLPSRVHSYRSLNIGPSFDYSLPCPWCQERNLKIPLTLSGVPLDAREGVDMSGNHVNRAPQPPPKGSPLTSQVHQRGRGM